MAGKSFEDRVGDALEEAYPGQVTRDGGTIKITVNPGDRPAEKGHNKVADATDDRLRLLVERIERLEEEKKGIAEDIRDVYAEAKAVGYDAKIMRICVRLRKMKPDDRSEMSMVLETYGNALGLQGVLPL